MAYEVVMPKAGMAMEFGTIIKWLKNIGDKVEYGEPLLEIETDKTSMQVEAMNDGYLLSKLYDEGDEVPVVTTIGYIGDKGEEVPNADEHVIAENVTSEDEPRVESGETKTIEKKSGQKVLATPAAKRIAKERGIDLSSLGIESIIRAKDIDDLAGISSKKATPLARSIAKINGVDIDGVSGSGFNGKVLKDDVVALIDKTPKMSVAEDEDQLVPLNGLRKTIAKRMLESHTDVPPVTLNTVADITELFEIRQQINSSVTDTKITFNDLVLRACSIALCECPEINASFSDKGIIQKKDVNIGMAVAIDGGLIVPVLKNANDMSLKELSKEAKMLSKKARDGQLLPDDYTNGTFTVSNLGMYGIMSFTPIVNLPECCILGVCAIVDKLKMADDGCISNHKEMGLSLTFDHRCIDGAVGANFLQRIVPLLEHPFELII